MPPNVPSDPVALLASYRYQTSKTKLVNWSTVRSIDIQRLSASAPDLQQMKQLTAAVVDCSLDNIKIPALMDTTTTNLLTPMDTVQLLRAMQVALQFTVHSQMCLRETYIATRDALTGTQFELGKYRGVGVADSQRSRVDADTLKEREQQWALERAQLQASIRRLEDDVKRAEAAKATAETSLQSRDAEIQRLTTEVALLKGQNAALMHKVNPMGAVAGAAASWIVGGDKENVAAHGVPDVQPRPDDQQRHRHSHRTHRRHHSHRRTSSSDERRPPLQSNHHTDVASVVTMMQQLLASAAQQQQAHLLSVQTLQQVAATQQQQQQQTNGGANRRESSGGLNSPSAKQHDEAMRGALLRLQTTMDDLRADVRRLEQVQGRDTKVFSEEMARLDDELRRVEQQRLEQRPHGTSDQLPSADAAALADRLTLIDRGLKSLRDEMNARLQEAPTPSQLSQLSHQVSNLTSVVEGHAKMHTQRLDQLTARVDTMSQGEANLRAVVDDVRMRANRHEDAISTLSAQPRVSDGLVPSSRPSLAPSRGASVVSSPVVAHQAPLTNTAGQPHAGQASGSRGNSARTSDYGDEVQVHAKEKNFYDDSDDPDLCPHCARPHPNLASHVANCPYRPENCRYCGERYSVQSKELHLAHCKEYNRPAALREEALAQQRVVTPNASMVTPSASFVAPASGDLDQSTSAVLSASTKAPPPTPAIASGRAKTKELKALNDELAALMAEEAEAEARKQQLAMSGTA